ncbi:hypothetical protein D7X33_09315 [Butyricicoccus sp. 1XD8-22]|nr:hypothetical protein D7X33_09315 [Butyricicoccus sp. 1XD8-22]
MVPLSLSWLTQTLLRAVSGVLQACTSRPFWGRAAQRLAKRVRRRRAANGGGFISCVPPPFPPVATRFVLDAGGRFALPRPPISRRAPSAWRLRCFARRRQKRRGGGEAPLLLRGPCCGKARPASFSGNFDFLIDFGCEKAYTK